VTPRSSPVTHARTEAKKAAFLLAFADCGVITIAARAAKVDRRQVFTWRQDDEQFAKAFDEAEESAHLALIAEARRRAADGYSEYVVSGGRLVNGPDGTPLLQTKYSDHLLKFLIELRQGKPTQRVEHTGDKPGDVKPAYVAAVLQELDRRRGLPPGEAED
jgi:hypothetical protein